MRLMPGSPRPGTPVPQDEDDGVYRSLFQQPMVDIPPIAPSYAWFEFLLHPEALQKHLTTLHQQRRQDVHSATSAIELIREFLDQAQLVADEGNVRNKRYSALLLVAAQVALKMQLSLSDIEETLPLHFQRLLLDGIVDFAEQSSRSHNDFKTDIVIQPYEAHVLHKRWTLRTLVNQSLNGFLTCTTRGEGEEILTTYQMALGDLMTSHLQIAKSIELIFKNEEKQALSVKTQLETLYDLGRYFFSFNGFEKAYSCFSQAFALLKDIEKGDQDLKEANSAKLSAEIQTNLEGYLAACKAVLEMQSIDGSSAALENPKLQIEMAWEGQNWDKIIDLLEADIVASELSRLPQGYRAALEQQALHLLWSSSNSNTIEDDPRIANHTLRFFYQRIVLENAMMFLLFEVGGDEAVTIENCICVCIRLLQDDKFYSTARSASSDSAAKYRFEALARFVVRLCEFSNLSAPDDCARARVKLFLIHVMRHYPCIAELVGVSELLRHCGNSSGTDGISHVSFAKSLDERIMVEDHLYRSIAKQKKHFCFMADVEKMFVFSSAYQREAFAAALQKEVIDMVKSDDGALANGRSSRNLITFCTANNYWATLSQWTTAKPFSSQLECELQFIVACGALIQYLSSLPASHLTANGNAVSIASLVSGIKESAEFSMTTSNKYMAEILLKWRDLVKVDCAEDSDNDQQNDERSTVLMGLPLWIVETLECISAGLLHRAYMRNACDYRISFDLNPYGELAFLEAFAPDVISLPSGSGAESTEISDEHFATVPFVKIFQVDLVDLHSRALHTLVSRCGREPRWQCAKADLLLNPLSKQRITSTSDPRAALESYLVAASLATNFFSDMVSVIDIIDQSSLVRLSQCLVQIGAHVAAAVLYQCFVPEEYKYGLRILRLAPESHDEGLFQYFWEMPFLELLVDLHSSPKYLNDRHVTLLTNLIQSPELNSSNTTPIVKDAEQRILRCYFRDLCRIYLSD